MFSTILAAVSHADLGTLFVVLAVFGFGLALYLAYVGRHAAAIIAAFIALLILIFGVGY